MSEQRYHKKVLGVVNKVIFGGDELGFETINGQTIWVCYVKEDLIRIVEKIEILIDYSIELILDTGSSEQEPILFDVCMYMPSSNLAEYDFEINNEAHLSACNEDVLEKLHTKYCADFLNENVIPPLMSNAFYRTEPNRRQSNLEKHHLVGQEIVVSVSSSRARELAIKAPDLSWLLGLSKSNWSEQSLIELKCHIVEHVVGQCYKVKVLLEGENLEYETVFIIRDNPRFSRSKYCSKNHYSLIDIEPFCQDFDNLLLKAVSLIYPDKDTVTRSDLSVFIDELSMKDYLNFLNAIVRLRDDEENLHQKTFRTTSLEKQVFISDNNSSSYSPSSKAFLTEDEVDSGLDDYLGW